MRERARRSQHEACAGPLQPSLTRPFRLFAFDWDGTAVVGREDDATPVRLRLERLLKLGIWIFVVTGTNFQNVDRQFSADMKGDFKQRLYVATNRGSEVYGFDVQSNPVRLHRRVATARENRLLKEIALANRSAIEGRTELAVNVVFNRLNRRKVDLIPERSYASVAICYPRRHRETGVDRGDII